MEINLEEAQLEGILLVMLLDDFFIQIHFIILINGNVEAIYIFKKN